MGRKSLVIIGVFSLIILLFVFGSTFAQSVVSTENKIELSLPHDQVFSQLHSLEFWKKWNWERPDETLEIEKIEGENGILWKSDYEGKGGLKIMEVLGDTLIRYELVTDNQNFVEHGEIKVFEKEMGCDIIWKSKIDFSTNVRAKYLSFLKDYQKLFEGYHDHQLNRIETILNEANSQ